ncbi:hypothetical protein CDEST_11892 [Colletotrichum destructivum]|uniref:Uncharacterized protein n=1 Tax=Colletotrichum destructivum TaxID=34406 RepID=A0AAX4IUF6_9PEZI|nr:hypothetical protein CDEST_11892 [Colletotrichum destructivum]
MAIEGLGFLPGLDSIEYYGIGMGTDLTALDSRTARSQSPGGSSISLGPREEVQELMFRSTKDDVSLLHHRRSCAPSPEPVVASDDTVSKSITLQKRDTQQTAQSDEDYPKTPVASSSSILTMTQTFAAPLESYLACPQPHEKRALYLLGDDDDREQKADSLENGSVVMGMRSVPGIYRVSARSLSPMDAVSRSRLGHMMERYLASDDVHDALTDDQLEQISSRYGREDSVEISGPEVEAAQSLGDSLSALDPLMALATSAAADSVAAAPAAMVPGEHIEVGSDHHDPDSAISDMEADELHQLLVGGREKQQATESSSHIGHRERESRNRSECELGDDIKGASLVWQF